MAENIENEEYLKKVEQRRKMGGKHASQPDDPDSLYPDGVDPTLADEGHNSRGQWSPYSEKQRKAASVLIRRYQKEGLSLQKATEKAFDDVGEPELIDEVTHGRQRQDEDKKIH